MKRNRGIFLLILGSLFCLRPGVAYGLDFKIPDKIFYTPPTSTPTPTPTVIIKFVPPLYKKFATSTPAPLTATPTPTLTPTGTSGAEGALSPTEEPEVVSPAESELVSPTPAPVGGVLGRGIGLKEAVGISIFSLLLLIIILQSQGQKIRNWLHKKTE